MNEAQGHEEQRALRDRTEPAERRSVVVLIAAVSGHLALLGVGNGLLTALAAGHSHSMVPLLTGAAAIALTVPIGLRLLRRGDAKSWWLVAPAVAVVAIGAIRAKSGSGASASAAEAAATSLAAALSLSAAATVLAARAAARAGRFTRAHAGLPLFVGFAGLAAVTVAVARRATPALLALPPATVGVAAIALLATLGAPGRMRSGVRAAQDATLIGWLVLGSIALCSFATGAVGAVLTSGAAQATGATDQVILISWFYSVPVVATMVAGFGLRSAQLGLAARLGKIDVLGTFALLIVAVAIAQNQLRASFNPAAPRPAAARVPARTQPVVATPQAAAAAAAVAADPAEPPEPAEAATVTEHGTVRVAMPTVEGPLLERDAVAGIQRAIARIDQCYRKAASAPARMNGTLRFVIDKTGSVVHVDQDTTWPEPLAKCVALELYRTGFPSPSSGRATVSAPIEFARPAAP
jgi:hypothetical protein